MAQLTVRQVGEKGKMEIHGSVIHVVEVDGCCWLLRNRIGKQFFVGTDISYTCCLMTIINLCLISLNGEVIHMNALSDSCWHRWCIVDSVTKIPTVYEVEEEKINQPPTCADDLKTYASDGTGTAC